MQDHRGGRQITASTASFVGRQYEVEVLSRHFAAAIRGQTQVVLVAGEPGIGKTRLLAHAAEQASEYGATVLRGGASEAEGMPPYLPLLEALGRYIRSIELDLLREQVGTDATTLASIFPELPGRLGELPTGYPLPVEQARLRLFEAVADFLAAIAARAPLVLVLDDLHWSDPATLDLLCHATRHQPSARLLILGAYREGEAGYNPALQRTIMELTRQRILTSLRIGPLSVEEIDQLASSQLATSVDPSLTQLLHTQSEGNPFFAEELLRGWLEQGALACEDERWRLSASQPPSGYDVLPVSILSAIRQRLTRLATETVDVLRVAAMVGRTFELSLLAQVRDEEVEIVEERLLEGIGAHLIHPEGTASYTFTHDKIRECLYAEVSGARRRRLHEVIGRVLEERYRHAASEHGPTQALADLAFHFARSGDLERGITYSVKAAEQARQSYAFEEALIQYQRALDLLDSTDRRRGDLLLRLGEMMLSAGQEDEAVASFETAHGLLIRSQPKGHRPAAAQAAHGLGMARWHQGALREAQIAFEAALALLEHHQGPETVRVLVDLAKLLNAGMGLQAEGLVYGERALELARRLDDKRLEAAASRTVGQLKYRGNDFAEGVELLERALVLASAIEDPAEAADICGNLANAYFARTEIERSRHMTLMRMEFAHRCHQPYELRHVHSWLALISILQGEWVQAEKMIGQAQSIVEKLSDDEPLAVLLRKRGLLAYYRDRFQEAERWFEEALAIVRPKGPQHVAWYLGLLALTRFALGKRREVLACMTELETVVAALPAQSLPTAPALTELTEIALWMGDRDRAERYYPQLSAFEGQMFHSMVDPALGAFETARGNWAAAEAYLSRAESAARREDLRPLLLRILQYRFDLEMARGGPDSAPRAHEALEEALKLCEELDLDDRASRIHAQLSTMHLPLTDRSRVRLPAGLSRREAEVLRLVAGGKSNREIAQELCLSERTVANHLTSIFNKTAVDNRAGAAAFAIRHGLA